MIQTLHHAPSTCHPTDEITSAIPSSHSTCVFSTLPALFARPKLTVMKRSFRILLPVPLYFSFFLYGFIKWDVTAWFIYHLTVDRFMSSAELSQTRFLIEIFSLSSLTVCPIRGCWRREFHFDVWMKSDLSKLALFLIHIYICAVATLSFSDREKKSRRNSTRLSRRAVLIKANESHPHTEIIIITEHVSSSSFDRISCGGI